MENDDSVLIKTNRELTIEAAASGWLAKATAALLKQLCSGDWQCREARVTDKDFIASSNMSNKSGI